MNLKELAKAKGTNLKQVAEKCGIPASTLYAISQGQSTFENVGVGKFLKVAEALGVTVEQLYESPNVTPETATYYFARLDDTDEATELLAIYRMLDEKGREVLMATARALNAR